MSQYFNDQFEKNQELIRRSDPPSPEAPREIDEWPDSKYQECVSCGCELVEEEYKFGKLCTDCFTNEV